MRSFKIYGIWPQASRHIYNFRKCSHASVGLTQACQAFMRYLTSSIPPYHASSLPCYLVCLLFGMPSLHLSTFLLVSQSR